MFINNRFKAKRVNLEKEKKQALICEELFGWHQFTE